MNVQNQAKNRSVQFQRGMLRTMRARNVTIRVQKPDLIHENTDEFVGSMQPPHQKKIKN